MTVTQRLKEGRPQRGESEPSRWPVPQILLFVGIILLIGAVNAPAGLWQGPEAGRLVDTDGYMRYLRVEELATGGDWFDSTSERSNYPVGESQHWTRPIDLYVLGLSTLLSPIAGADSLYWAAVLNAPILLVAIGIALYAAFANLPGSVRVLTMLMLLGLVPVTSYASPGRVDHHAALLLVFVLVVGALLRALAGNGGPWQMTALVAVGIWLSTEFLVPTALVALTVGILSTVRGDVAIAEYGARVFAGAALGVAVFLAVERGPGFWAIEYDKISVVHIGIAAIVALAFAGLRFGLGPSLGRNWMLLATLATAGVLLLLVVFPGLAGGPFVEVDPRVKELWLYTVRELRPVWSVGSWATITILLGPLVVGLAAGLWELRRPGAARGWVPVVVGWLAAYALLTTFQVRWAMFGQVLAVPLVLQAIHRWYERLEGRRLTVVVRPLVIVILIFGLQLVGIGLDPASASPAEGPDCRLGDVIPTLEQQETTTVLAGQDVGPEILYRTDHRVIATPYHRNESGILFVHDVMAMSISEGTDIETRLAERDVGLILVCPNAAGLLQPADPTGTFYGRLVNGRPPHFVEVLPTASDTDYLVFSVEPRHAPASPSA